MDKLESKKVYEANCIENGENFYVVFKTEETDSHKLYLYGKQISGGWGGECISVDSSTDYTNINDVYDFDIENEGWILGMTLKQWRA
jgi:hypothetical protein